MFFGWRFKEDAWGCGRASHSSSGLRCCCRRRLRTRRCARPDRSMARRETRRARSSPRADLVLEDAGTGLIIDGHGDNDGGFVFPNLQPGRYRLTAVAQGFQPGAQHQLVPVCLHVAEFPQLTAYRLRTHLLRHSHAIGLDLAVGVIRADADMQPAARDTNTNSTSPLEWEPATSIVR